MTWTSKSESGSTASPVADRSQSANRALAARLAARNPWRKAGSSARGTIPRSCDEVGDPAVADRVGEEGGQAGVGQEQPAPGGDAVGLVVEPLGEEPGEVLQHGLPQQAGVERGDAVGAVRPDDRQVGHPDLLLRALLDQADPRRQAVVAGGLRADLVEEPAVDLVDDLQQPRGHQLEEADGPPLQGLGQERVVGVGQRPAGQVPRLVPAEPGLVEEDPHQLGDGQRGVGVVELDRDLVGEGLPVVAAGAEPPDDVGERAADQEVLLREPQPLAGPGGVVGVEDAGQVLGRDLLVHGAEEVAAAELGEVEGVGRRRPPEPQRVDRLAAVADDRPVVGHPAEDGRAVGDEGRGPAVGLDRAVDADVHRLRGAVDLPRVGPAEPVVGALDLAAALDLLAEDPVLVPQAVPDRRDREGGHRVDEAGGEPAEAAVAEPGVGLLLVEPVEVHALPPHLLAHERLDEEVEEVVGRRPADEELHRQVIDLLGVLAVVGVAGSSASAGRAGRGATAPAPRTARAGWRRRA